MAETPPIFEGIAMEELERCLGELERRRFPAGSIVVAEGDTTPELYITQSGWADVVVADRHGVEHQVGRVAPGTTVGEMSVLTGQSAAATVRARDDLDVLVLSERQLERAATRFPRIYRNLGTILAQRLAHTNRVSLRASRGRLTVLQDIGAPPLLGYALACSIAWHTRSSTLFLLLGEDPPEELSHLETIPADPVLAHARGSRDGAGGAEVMLAQPVGPFARERLADTVDDLLTSFDYVLLQTRDRRYGGSDSMTLVVTGPAGSDDGVASKHVLRGWATDTVRVARGSGFTIPVPRLEAADEATLKGGLLPTRTPAGNALGWVARDLTGLSVGLALGAGSLRGYAHFGVLRVLERIGLIPDYLAGTSVGGCVAAMYAAGYGIDECADLLDRGGKLLLRPTVPTRALLSSRSFRHFLQSLGPDVRFEDLPVPLALVTGDLTTGLEVVLRRGIVWRAVLATMSIPGIFPAQRVGPYTLVDGGIVNPVPSTACEQMGARTVIGVKLVSPPGEADWSGESVVTTGRPPSSISVILRSIEMMQSRIEVEPTTATRITITPTYADRAPAKLRNFKTGRRFIEDGEAAAEEALPRITTALPWLRP